MDSTYNITADILNVNNNLSKNNKYKGGVSPPLQGKYLPPGGRWRGASRDG